MNACITRETFVFKVFLRVFHSSLKLELCRHACRRRDPIISTCRYGKNMPTTALLITRHDHFEMALYKCLLYVCMYVCKNRSMVLLHTMNYYSWRQMATSSISECEYNIYVSCLARMQGCNLSISL